MADGGCVELSTSADEQGSLPPVTNEAGPHASPQPPIPAPDAGLPKAPAQEPPPPISSDIDGIGQFPATSGTAGDVIANSDANANATAEVEATAEAASDAITSRPPSDIDFGCSALRACKLDATVERGLIERQIEVASTWTKVRSVDASTVRFKLERVLSGPNGEPPQVAATAAEVEVIRCDLRVKEIELKIAQLKEDELKVKLRDAWRKEGEEMQKQLATLKHTVETVKLYPHLVAMKPRTTFFFSDCQHEGPWGIGRWYCETLSERPHWRRYPAEKWFVTQKGAQLWAPLGKVYMDYTDQDVYSYSSNLVPGSQWVSDKGRFGKVMSERGGVPGMKVLPTWYIHKGQWSAPPREADGEFDPEQCGMQWAPAPGDIPEAQASAIPDGEQVPADTHVWFLKETNRNYAAGTFVHPSATACFLAAEQEKNYVVQRHYENPMLIDGCKFHIRVYLLAHSPAGARRLRWLVYSQPAAPEERRVIPTDNTNQNKAFTGANRCGFLAKATSPWVANDVDRDVQITRDRTSSLLTWEHYDKSWALIMSTLRKVTKHVSHKFKPTVKASFELFGIDLAFTADWGVCCYEINSAPSMKPTSKPMLHDLMDVVLPFGYEPRVPAGEDSWHLAYECEPDVLREEIAAAEPAAVAARGDGPEAAATVVAAPAVEQQNAAPPLPATAEPDVERAAEVRADEDERGSSADITVSLEVDG